MKNVIAFGALSLFILVLSVVLGNLADIIPSAEAASNRCRFNYTTCVRYGAYGCNNKGGCMARCIDRKIRIVSQCRKYGSEYPGYCTRQGNPFGVTHCQYKGG